MLNVKEIKYFVERLGTPLLICAFFAYIIFVKFEKLESKIDRTIRNTRAIMTELNIPVHVDSLPGAKESQ